MTTPTNINYLPASALAKLYEIKLGVPADRRWGKNRLLAAVRQFDEEQNIKLALGL